MMKIRFWSSERQKHSTLCKLCFSNSLASVLCLKCFHQRQFNSDQEHVVFLVVVEARCLEVTDFIPHHPDWEEREVYSLWLCIRSIRADSMLRQMFWCSISGCKEKLIMFQLEGKNLRWIFYGRASWTHRSESGRRVCSEANQQKRFDGQIMMQGRKIVLLSAWTSETSGWVMRASRWSDVCRFQPVLEAETRRWTLCYYSVFKVHPQVNQGARPLVQAWKYRLH